MANTAPKPLRQSVGRRPPVSKRSVSPKSPATAPESLGTDPFSDATPGKSRRRVRKDAATRRLELRETLWPAAEKELWHRKIDDGYTTVPRVVSLVGALIKKLSKTGDASSVYFDLWCRSFDEALIQITDEAACAYSAGYEGIRAERTWGERMMILEELGFIRIKPLGNRKFACVLLRNPLLVVAEIRKRTPRLISEEWWNAFTARVDEVAAVIPDPE